MRGLVAVVTLLAACGPVAGLPPDAEPLLKEAFDEGSAGIIPEYKVSADLGNALNRAAFYDDGILAVRPNTNSAPWYTVEATPVFGEMQAAFARDTRTFETTNIKFSDVECWSEEKTRFCAGNATAEVKPAASSHRFLDLEPLPPITTRFVIFRSPRIGRWVVDDRDRLVRVSHNHLTTHVDQALTSRAGRFDDQISADVARASREASELIYASISEQISVDGNVVTIKDDGLQFSRSPVEGSSYIDVWSRCDSLALAGRDDWRMPTWREMSRILKADPTTIANREYWPIDTPDRRVWGTTFDYLPGRQVNQMFLTDTFFILGRREGYRMAEFRLQKRAPWMLMVIRLDDESVGGRDSRGGAALDDDSSTGPNGYWSAGELATPWHHRLLALCVRGGGSKD